MIYNSFNIIYIYICIFIYFSLYIKILYISEIYSIYIHSNFSYFFETKVRKTQLY